MSNEEEIRDCLRSIDKRLDMMEVSIAKQSKDLEYHIKRTDFLEDQLLPIKTIHSQIIGIVKFIAWLGVLVALAEGLKQLLH